MKNNTRRSFLRKVGQGAAALATGSGLQVISADELRAERLSLKQRIAANDKIRVACIGTGDMGIGNTNTALQVPGIEVVAACDLYNGRLTRAKELWGAEVFTTRDYREILARTDIDAVINATSDHWHEVISIAAMEAGKAVYCEKPMVHKVEEGHRVIKAQAKTKAVFQVGSQFVSGLIFLKAKTLFEQGTIGKLNMAEAIFDRFDPIGAWQYPIPPDASTDTVDWDTYLSNTQKRDWDPLRFFRWRNYLDYGTGVSGDLFVHLLSMLHFVVSSKGPTHVFSTGGLRYWNDGREVPDLQIGTFDYPETPQHPAFNLVLRANFVDGSGGNYFFRLVGDEGEMRIGWNTLEISQKKLPNPRLSVNSFSQAMQEAYAAEHAKMFPPKPTLEGPGKLTYTLPRDYKGDRYEHFVNFFESMRQGTPVVEDASFGLRATGPTLAGNKSFFEKRVIAWDPEKMQMLGK